MAGYFAEGVCRESLQEAIDAHYQSIPPTIIPSTGDSLMLEYIRLATPQWNMKFTKIANNGGVTQLYSTVAPTPVFGSCTLNDPTTNFTTGMELGWAVATVMIIVFVIRRTYRGF